MTFQSPNFKLFFALAAIVGLARPSLAAEQVGTGYSATTDKGAYRIVLTPVPFAIPLGPIHSWTIEIRTADGDPVVPKRFVIFGGMPEHRHALPTQPKITRQLAEGKYLIEGMKFNMYGHWQLVVGVDGPRGPDKSTFDLVLSSEPDTVAPKPDRWTDAEWQIMQSLALPDDQSPRPDLSNRFDGVNSAIELGRTLFFDTRLSRNDDLSCASCHRPELKFTDGLRLSKGSSVLKRHSPTLIGLSHSDWFYWDGRRDSLWSQALAPIEMTGEMDNTRTAVVQLIAGVTEYRDAYRDIGGKLPVDLEKLPVSAGPFGAELDKDAWSKLSLQEQKEINTAFADIGKIIGSFVATLEPKKSRFDLYVDALRQGDKLAAHQILSEAEASGLKLFLDSTKTACLRCHSGPYFTNFGFHNVGTGVADNGTKDFGRMVGRMAVDIDLFNCKGPFNDASSDDCTKSRFSIEAHGEDGAFKVPTLRNISLTAPYMHDGRFSTLEDVMAFYKTPPDPIESGHELPALDLTPKEVANLIAFLGSLSEIED